MSTRKCVGLMFILFVLGLYWITISVYVFRLWGLILGF